MARRRQIYEGKAKILYEGPEPGTLIQYFKDDATAFNAQKRGTISGKGVINNQISEHIFTALADHWSSNAFHSPPQHARAAHSSGQIIPIEIVVRNVAAGLFEAAGNRRRHSAPSDDDRILLQGRCSWRSDDRGRAYRLLWLGDQDEMNDIADMAIRVNDFLCGMFSAIGIRLVDFKLEFGRVWDGDDGRVILADEISPDGCRLWDVKTNQKLDKDRFRQDLGEVEEAYQEVARRLGLLRDDDEFAVLDLDTHRKKRGR